MLKTTGQMILKGMLKVIAMPAIIPTLVFLDTSSISNLSYSGAGTTSDRVIGYVGGLGNDTNHILRFTVEVSGMLFFKITASSEAGFDIGSIKRTRAATTITLGTVSGVSVLESTASVLINDIISIEYSRDESGTSGLDQVTIDYLYIV